MTLELTRLELAEIGLLVAGWTLVLIAAAVLAARRGWAEVLRLPEPAANQFDGPDLLAGFLAIWFLPGLFFHLFDLLPLGAASEATATQPADLAASQPAPAVGLSATNVLALATGQVGAVVILALVGRLRVSGGLRGWGLAVSRLPGDLGRAVLTYIAVWPICSVLLYATIAAVHLAAPSYVPEEHEAIRTLRSPATPAWLLATTIFSTLVLAPVVEELFFRGLLQTMLATWWRSRWAAIAFSGCAFGVFHLLLGHTVPALIFFGVVLGYVYARTRSLTLAILLHAVFNGKTLLWLALGA